MLLAIINKSFLLFIFHPFTISGLGLVLLDSVDLMATYLRCGHIQSEYRIFPEKKG